MRRNEEPRGRLGVLHLRSTVHGPRSTFIVRYKIGSRSWSRAGCRLMSQQTDDLRALEIRKKRNQNGCSWRYREKRLFSRRPVGPMVLPTGWDERPWPKETNHALIGRAAEVPRCPGRKRQVDGDSRVVTGRRARYVEKSFAAPVNAWQSTRSVVLQVYHV